MKKPPCRTKRVPIHCTKVKASECYPNDLIYLHETDNPNYYLFIVEANQNDRVHGFSIFSYLKTKKFTWPAYTLSRYQTTRCERMYDDTLNYEYYKLDADYYGKYKYQGGVGYYWYEEDDNRGHIEFGNLK